MQQYIEDWLLKEMNATSILNQKKIQTLWSGYGSIQRVQVQGSHVSSVILKHVTPPKQTQHPRGWSSKHSHLRKIKSYQVETAWYQNWAQYCGQACRIPKLYASKSLENEFLILMEDLDASGFSLRKQSLIQPEIQHCIAWLANFHAIFLGKQPTGLWENGSYWHLATRPDEWAVMQDLPLKNAAQWIDQELNQCTFKTFIHGDAKLANFCFSPTGSVAAVDFQYVGRGCGMKDLTYFLGSCLDEQNLEQWHQTALDYYFECLCAALKLSPNLNFEALETEWRSLYPFAWADFQRFLSGWMPGHTKINAYTQKMVVQVLERF